MLELMRLSPQRSYICLIPPPLKDPPEDSVEAQAESSPLQSLSLLQPLSGSCLYVCLFFRLLGTLSIQDLF